jgi:PmbA protein
MTMDEQQLRAWGEPLSQRGLEWELYAVDSASTSIEVREGEVDAFKTSRTQGVAVRIRENERMGFSFSTSLEPESIARMVEQARAAGAALEPNEHARLATATSPVPDLELVDEAGQRRPVQEKIEAARAIEATALAADPRVKRVRKASYSESDGREWLLNSHGVFRQARSTFYSASVLAIAEAAGQSESGGEFQFGRSWGALDFDWIGREAAHRALRQLGARGMPTGRLSVVFENRVVADLLGVLSSSFLGESVQRNRSLLAGKLDQAIMAPLVTIVDDGLDVRGAGAFPFDGEGMPHQCTTLVSGGVLQGYLYDLETGARDRRPSTGNAGRGGFRSPPGPGTTNLRLEPGAGTAESLCAQAGNGFLITDLLGLHTANPISGEFSLGAAGFEIVNGEIGDPIRGVAVADNVLGLFRRVTQVAGDFRYFGSIGAASMLVPEVSVSGG